MKTAIQFGAGNIGRGFMGQLFHEAGYRICFVDVSVNLVNSLKASRSYTLRLLDAKTRREIDMSIDKIDAYSIDEQENIINEITHCDIVGTAVGVKNLADIAPILARGISKRRTENGYPLDIYLCENMLNAAELLKKHVFNLLKDEKDYTWAEEHIGFVGTTVARMVPQARPEILSKNPLMVIADSYHKLPYNGKVTKAAPPPIEGFYPVSNFRAEVEKKLFVYNLGHAALAYLGYLKGYTYVHETMRNKELKKIFWGAINETCTALIKRYPNYITTDSIAYVKEDIELRFGNPLIQDTIKRVGRDPIRKLGKNERLIGSALFCESQSIKPKYISKVIGAALLYYQPQDKESIKLQEKITDNGIETAINELTSVKTNSQLFNSILEAYKFWLEFYKH